jgi:CzcA family heavy metal efflux pump
MLALFVRASVRHAGVVIALGALLVIYGAYRLLHTSLDIFPEFSPKLVIIQTEAPGLSAEQAEVLVTQPIENALGGLVALVSIRSQTIPGLSVVTLTFEESTDLYRDRQLVAERLGALSALLPDGLGPPVMVPLTSSSSTVMTIGFTSETRSAMELRGLVDFTIKPRLLSVPGVADVNVFGGDVAQLQIQIDPDRLKLHGLSIQDVVDSARQATGIRGAGFLENRNQYIVLRTSGQPESAEALAKIVVARPGGAKLLLGDVAEIKMGAAPPISQATVLGEPGIVVMVIGQLGADTMAVTREVEATLAEFDAVLQSQGVTLRPDLFRPAGYIERSLANITNHLMVGAALVVGILFLFLFNLRGAFISATAIPISLIAAALVLVEFGQSINIMVLGGLAIALGEVVDDAIIDTENIYRRLRENQGRAEPLPTRDVVYAASMEVRGSVVHASFIVALVFVPLLTIGGVAGRMFEPLGIAYILAILASLIVALSITPALCAALLAHRRLKSADPPLIRAIKPAYGLILRVICRRSGLAIGLVAALLAVGLSILPRLGGGFLPELREGHYMIHSSAVPGTSLDETIRVGTRITEEVMKIPGVRSVSQWAGRAERGADTFGSHYAEYEVELDVLSGSEQQRVLDSIRSVLASFPGITTEVNTFLIERVDETISGYTAPVVVNIYGDDLDLLDRKALQVAALMETVPGATDVQLRAPSGQPILDVRLRLDALARRGVLPIDVFETVRTAYEGTRVGEIYHGNRVVPVTVILPPARRAQPGPVGRLPVRALNGALVPLDQLADIHQEVGRYMILHAGARRLQTVTSSVTGRDLASFLDELKERIYDQVDFPSGTFVEFTGAAVAQAEAKRQLIVHSLLAGVGILLLLYVALGGIRNTLLVLVNLPFSLVGGVVAALLTGGWLSVGSLVGFVTLFGITLRNSIMLVSHYQHLVDHEGMEWGLETAIRGAQERLPSILITALVTALAMLPIALNSDNAGREIMGPMAAIIIGGLASSTILNLLVLPALMLRAGRFERREDKATDVTETPNGAKP